MSNACLQICVLVIKKRQFFSAIELQRILAYSSLMTAEPNSVADEMNS